MAVSRRAILARRDFQRLYGLLGRIELGDFGDAVHRAVSLGDLALEILYGGAVPGLAVQVIDGFMQTRQRVGVGEFEADGGKTVEEQLAEIGQKSGLARLNAVAGGKLEDFAKDVIDRGGGAEVFDAGEEIVGKVFCFTLLQTRVVGAERIVVPGSEHAAAVVVGGNEPAMVFGVYKSGLSFGGHWVFLGGTVR